MAKNRLGTSDDFGWPRTFWELWSYKSSSQCSQCARTRSEDIVCEAIEWASSLYTFNASGVLELVVLGTMMYNYHTIVSAYPCISPSSISFACATTSLLSSFLHPQAKFESWSTKKNIKRPVCFCYGACWLHSDQVPEIRKNVPPTWMIMVDLRVASWSILPSYNVSFLLILIAQRESAWASLELQSQSWSCVFHLVIFTIECAVQKTKKWQANCQ